MRTMIVAVASGKGGTGKSLLSVCLAVKAMQEGGKAALIDMEPQGSATLWWKLRSKPDNPLAVDGSQTSVADDARELRGDGYTHIIVDTSPTFIDRIEEAIEAATAVLIPVRASVFDIAAVRAVVDLCKQHRKPFAFVWMDYDGGWARLNASVSSALPKMGKLLEHKTSHRSAYPTALNLGKSGAEHPDARQRREVAAEISGIWEELQELATEKVSRHAGR